MFKVENILLFLIVIVCFLVSLVLVMLVIKPEIFPGPVYASGTQEEVFIPVEESSDESDQRADEDWQVYRNEDFAFEISYPDTVIQKSALDQGALNAGIGVSPGTPVWQFRLDDEGNYQGTNLIDASLVIHVGNQEGDTSRCSEFKPGSITKTKYDAPPAVEINGISFWQDIVQEGVMGGAYYQVSYRAVHQGACYEITQVIQSSNQESFAGESISSFDLEKVTGKLDKVLETFKFLDGAASFPPQSYPEPKFVEGAVDKDATEHVDGLDVSHWQGDINWTKVANNDYIFTFVKGTEGVGWTDVKFFTNITEGTEAGVVMGVYHFARPDLGNTGQEEAEYFLSVVGDYLESGYLRPVLDLEVGSNLGKEALSAWVLDWLQTVENQSGVAPLIYTNYNYVSYFLTDPVADYDLWIAYWNCDPTPTYDIPPTGMWSDWGFWQYCVKPAGTVPGITTPIDMNIFNGVEEGLSEFDAASPLWVSLTNFITAAPSPHYADITADVNGDAVGTINYAFWWDCTSLEVDITAASASCGELPAPAEGECLENEYGVRCSAIAEEVKMVEHTYQEIGDYTAKVIVERDGAPPAEDRYQITVYNPILSLTADPVSPAVGIINQPFALTVSVDMKTSVSGALQVDMIEDGTGTIIDTGCQTVPHDTYVTRNFDFTLTDSEVIIRDYTLNARYRASHDCPIEDTDPDDWSQAYQLQWSLPYDAAGFYSVDQLRWFLKTGHEDGWNDLLSPIYGPADINGWIPIAGDWNGDGVDYPGFYSVEQRRWFLKTNLEHGWDDLIGPEFGPADITGWFPVAGDWNGDGIDNVGFYCADQHRWFLKTDHEHGWNDLISPKFGPADINGWIPVAGDWDGDGIDTLGFYSVEQMRWFLKTDHEHGWDNLIAPKFGPADINGWFPIAGDWTGDGVDYAGFYSVDQIRWFLKTDHEHGWDNLIGPIFGPVDINGWIVTSGNW